MRRVLIALFVGVVAGAMIFGGVLVGTGQFAQKPSAVGLNEIASNGNVQGRLYPGDPEVEAQLVEAEDSRLAYVRTVTSAAAWHFTGASEPYRIQTGKRTSLVLTPREQPYTLNDLAALLDEGLQVAETGALLLTESVVVLAGATLKIQPDGPLALLLDSTPESFVSILSLGGTLDMTGSLTAPIAIGSWDSTKGQTDVTTADGRGYIRAIGGTVALGYAFFADLGFWSGNTGGVSISGSSTEVAAESLANDAIAFDRAGAPLLPAIEVDAFALDRATNVSGVTATIEQTSFLRNAFGLFITDADGVSIKHVVIDESLIDGLVLHRFVTNAVVSDTSSTGNAVDGITVSRSSESLEFRQVTSSGNGRNGLSFDGAPLADGPSPAGSTVLNYGDSVIADGTFSDNGRYGVEIAGATSITVRDSTISGNDIGIVTSGLASQVDIVGNSFVDQVRQSVAVRDGASEVLVAQNDIAQGDTGVYIRQSEVLVEDNSLSGITNHGITLVGDVRGTLVNDNTIGGSGTTPVYRDSAATAALVAGNRTETWRPAITPASITKSLFQPLTVVWLSLGFLLLLTALLRTRRRGFSVVDPYENITPLSSFTRGIVSPLPAKRGG